MSIRVWNDGVMRIASVMSLSPFERAQIAKAEASARGVVLLDMKHMAERYVPVPEAEHIWLFYLPDFTRLFKDWYATYIDQIFAVYRPKASAEMSIEGAYLTLKYEGERPRDVVAILFTSGDREGVLRLLRESKAAEREATKSLDHFAAALETNSAIDLSEVIQTVSRFAAYALNNVFPEELITEPYPWVELARLYVTPVSSWRTLWTRARDLLEAVACGEMDEETAIERYARNTSHLRWGDIESPEDDLAFTHRFFTGVRRELPTLRALVQSRVEEYEARRMMGAPELVRARRWEAYRAELWVNSYACPPEPWRRRELVHKDRGEFDLLAQFAREAQEYNEWRRIIFTRTLRLVREYCERRGLDWHTISLETLAQTNPLSRIEVRARNVEQRKEVAA